MSDSEVYGLRSPAPEPAPDHAEQLVAVRRAIYDARTQANHWRLVTGVASALEFANGRDRDADVLEHVLRRLIADPQPAVPVQGAGEGEVPVAGGPVAVPPAPRGRYIVGPDGVAYGPFEESDDVP